MPMREDEHREREQQVHRAGEQRVERAAVVAGEQAHRHADDHDERGRDERDLERDAAAVDRAAEDVAARACRRRTDARRRGPSGWPKSSVRSAFVVCGFGVPTIFTIRGARIATNDQDHEPERDHGELVLAEAPPEQLRRRPRGDLPLGAGGLDRERLLGPGQKLRGTGAHGLVPLMSYLVAMVAASPVPGALSQARVTVLLSRRVGRQCDGP